jgi:hypothetical protein
LFVFKSPKGEINKMFRITECLEFAGQLSRHSMNGVVRRRIKNNSMSKINLK